MDNLDGYGWIIWMDLDGYMDGYEWIIWMDMNG